MNPEMQRIFNCGIVPVVVIENARDAVPAAKALKAGGIDVIEITMRTEAGLQAIENIRRDFPEMLVAAGTVLSVEKCRACIDTGARAIVSPGLDEKIVEYCLSKDITPIPGCVTPTEIQRAMTYDLEVLKFFPANVYGGMEAIKALAGPFGNVSFIPTGGVNEHNLGAYTSLPNVFAIGGSWVCTRGDITAGAFDQITELSARARQVMMGFEFAHLGINTSGEQESKTSAETLQDIFGFPLRTGSGSNFASDSIEVVKKKYLGEHGHVAIRTNNIQRAVAYLESRGYMVDPSTANIKNERMLAVYLVEQISGFAVHLLQK